MAGPSRRLLADHTTLRVGGPADAWVTATTEDELCDAVRSADAAGQPILILSGGSNLLVADDGFRGTVVEVATRGITVEALPNRVRLTVAAGEPWDDVVARAVEQEWAGIEALSGIPGSTGATPIQNVGAYGQDVAGVVHSVRVLDRHSGVTQDLPAADCGFGYRSSRFKAEPDRWVVLAVTMDLRPDGEGVVRYAELADRLGCEVGDRRPLSSIREEVLTLRRGKGMVLDEQDHDTWSAGSFFTNPIVSLERAQELPPECPRYLIDGGVKLSAAWLIEHAGVSRGFALPGSRAAVSTKHTLALTNRGGANATELLALATDVQNRVLSAFGISLEPEPRIVAATAPR